MSISRLKDSELPSAAIIILNWNTWADLLECLESVLRLNYPDFLVVVCDNGSTDGSCKRVRQWARGGLDVIPDRKKMANFVRPPVTKPISVNSLSREQVEQAAGEPLETPSLVLIENGDNIGFAAGNNVGLKYGLHHGYDYFWLLNPDTVVDRNALRPLIGRMISDAGVGMCGSVLRYYEAPQMIEQAGGCAYHPSVGLATRVLGDRTFDDHSNWQAVEQRLDYISGASCLLSRSFLQDVGLMSEDYFLYGEEIDWSYRSQGKYRLALAPESTVYHKKGRSIGSKALDRRRSPWSCYYLWRARVRVTRRYHSVSLPAVVGLGLLAAAGKYVLGEKQTAHAIYRGVLDRRKS